MLAASEPGRGCVPRELGHHVDLSIPKTERRPWSPCVHLEFNEGQDSGTVIAHGQVGPQPGTWTFFFFAFVHGGMIALFGFVLAFVQLTLDQAAWGLWIGVAGLVLTAAVYAATQIGRRLAADQTARLMGIVDAAFVDATGRA